MADSELPAPRTLEGRVAFVTGGARGIGRGIALALAEAGADVAVADLNPEPFRGERYFRLRERFSDDSETVSTAESVQALGRRGVQLKVDVGDPDSVGRATAECTEALGPIDILVNNAGIVNNIATIAEMTAEAWTKEIEVNLTGAFHCVRATVPAMAERGFGRVVNIASIAARAPALGQPAYTASKAGLVGFTQSVAQEFGPRGVTANAILPGLIATPLVKSMPERIRTAIVGQTPVGRIGEPADIGALATFLASPSASFVSGTAIPCDGGFLGSSGSGFT